MTNLPCLAYSIQVNKGVHYTALEGRRPHGSLFNCGVMNAFVLLFVPGGMRYSKMIFLPRCKEGLVEQAEKG